MGRIREGPFPWSLGPTFFSLQDSGEGLWVLRARPLPMEGVFALPVLTCDFISLGRPGSPPIDGKPGAGKAPGGRGSGQRANGHFWSFWRYGRALKGLSEAQDLKAGRRPFPPEPAPRFVPFRGRAQPPPDSMAVSSEVGSELCDSRKRVGEGSLQRQWRAPSLV